MALASPETFKNWTKEDWDRAISDIQKQPIFYGLDMSIKGDDKTCFTFNFPHNFKIKDIVKFGNNKFKVINVPFSTTIEVSLFKRKSKGYRKYIRRMKAKGLM